MGRKALILCARMNVDYNEYADAIKIGVEQGCLELIANQQPIDLAIGDFDHVTPTEFALINQHAKRVVKFVQAKDFIDGEMAIIHAQDLGCDQIDLYCKGNRLDMNLACCYLADHYQVVVHTEFARIVPFQLGVHKIPYLSAYQHFSFFSLGAATVDIQQFKFNVTNFPMTGLSTNAMCNEFINQQPGCITVHSGRILAVYGI